MLEKFILSEKDYEYLTKGIASGVAIGIIVGVIIKDIVLGFALGGVVGIIGGCIYSYYKRIKSKMLKNKTEENGIKFKY